MYQRIIELTTAQESIELKEYLELNFIPCSIGQYTPSSDSNEEVKTIFFLSFLDQYFAEYQKIAKTEYPTKLLKIKETKKAPKSLFRNLFLILYSILATLLCVKFYYTSESINFEKHFKYTWRTDNKTLDVRYKTTKKIIATYEDKNYDRNWEKIYEYQNGRKLLEASDLNENGIFEEFIYFDSNGNIAGVHKDSDQDGLLDTMKLFLENKEEIIFVDENKNGLFKAITKASHNNE